MKIVLVNHQYHIKDESQAEITVLRAAPYRRWDDKQRCWILPAIPSNREYLASKGFPALNPTMPQETPPEYPTLLPPMGQQKEAIERSHNKEAFALFMEPGLGKTKCLIDDFVINRQKGYVDGMVVVCPNSITGNWVEEIGKHCGLTCNIHVWKCGGEKKWRQWMDTPLTANPILIIAVESLSTQRATDVLRNTLEKFRMSLCVDESSRIKEHGAKRTKNLISVGKLAKMRRIATGTPATKGLQNLWSQYEFLDPNIIDANYYAFRAMFCIMGGFNAKTIVANKNQELFMELTAPYNYAATKEKWLTDLPEKTYQKRVCPLPDEWAAEYQKIFAETEHVLVRNLRLHQLLGGFRVKQEAMQSLTRLAENSPELVLKMLNEGSMSGNAYTTERLAGNNPRIAELVNIVEETPGKIVIWANYRAEIDIIVEALAPYGVAVQFHGGITNEQRNFKRQAFQNDKIVRFFVGQIATGGIGITLTAASTTIYYSNSWSAENRIQSEDRVHRIGQKNACIYIDLLSDGHRMDAKVLASAQKGIDFQKTLFDGLDSKLGQL